MNTFAQNNDYDISLRGKRIISFLRIEWLIIIKIWVPFTQRYIAPSMVEIVPVVLKKSILKISSRYLTILYNPPLKKEVALHLKKFESSLPKNALFQVWLQLAQWFWSRRRKCEKFTTTTTTTTTTRKSTSHHEKSTSHHDKSVTTS